MLRKYLTNLYIKYHIYFIDFKVFCGTGSECRDILSITRRVRRKLETSSNRDALRTVGFRALGERGDLTVLEILAEGAPLSEVP